MFLDLHEASKMIHALQPKYTILPKVEPEENLQVLCPMHSDTTKSARIYTGGKTMYCFTCKKMWRPAALVHDALELSWAETYKLINSKGFEVEKYQVSDLDKSLNISTNSIQDMLLTPDDFDRFMLFILTLAPKTPEFHELLDELYVDYINGTLEEEELVDMLLDSFNIDPTRVRRLYAEIS